MDRLIGHDPAHREVSARSRSLCLMHFFAPTQPLWYGGWNQAGKGQPSRRPAGWRNYRRSSDAPHRRPRPASRTSPHAVDALDDADSLSRNTSKENAPGSRRGDRQGFPFRRWFAELAGGVEGLLRVVVFPTVQTPGTSWPASRAADAQPPEPAVAGGAGKAPLFVLPVARPERATERLHAVIRRRFGARCRGIRAAA